MSDIRIAQEFDANLPHLSKPVRISSFHDAQVFVRRWAIRDKDLAIRKLRGRMDRANSTESSDSAMQALKHELAARDLLPDTKSPLR